jgi:hypothetical protein
MCGGMGNCLGPGTVPRFRKQAAQRGSAARLASQLEVGK